jgi:hypothetical protein
MGTGAPKPPTWADIQHVIDKVDQVCRESELVRAQAERSLRRRDFWPDRRQPPRHHSHPQKTSDPQDDSSSEGTDGTL